MSACKLSLWKQNRIMPELPGLKRDGLRFLVEASYFDCCEARGLRWDPKLDLARSCKLLRRKKNLDALVSQFVSTWPECSLTPEPVERDKIYFLRWLNQIQSEPIRRGSLISQQRDGGKPGFFWWLAFYTTWYFGYRAHVFNLGRSKDHEMIPQVSPEEYPVIYFLDNVNELWKPRFKEQVSTIINWCEHSEVPLWIEIRDLTPGKQSSGKILELKEAFKVYLTKMKSRPVLNWLEADCLSRLLRVCSKGAPPDFLKGENLVNMDT